MAMQMSKLQHGASNDFTWVWCGANLDLALPSRCRSCVASGTPGCGWEFREVVALNPSIGVPAALSRPRGRPMPVLVHHPCHEATTMTVMPTQVTIV